MAVASVAPFHLGYRPALDGLRGLAALAGMLYHSGLLPGGWLGVDVFFTLSGFLITSLLLEEHDRTGRVSLRRFYARRALRLLPALLALVAVCGTIRAERFVSRSLSPSGVEPTRPAGTAGCRGSMPVLSVGTMNGVGMIGLGLLGHALASRLLASGHAVVGHDVLPERLDALVALGGKGAGSTAEVARQAEAVCVVLPTLASVEDAILGADGIVAHSRPGSTVIQMSTISPALTERLARETAARGRRFLDCPVSGTSAMVARGEGLIIAGGEAAAVERWRPVLEAMLPRVVHVGPAGHATFVKLVANLLVGVHSLAAAEALTMARKAGVDLARVLEILTAGAAGSRMLEVRGPMIVAGIFPPQMKLDLFMKDLRLIQEAARAVGAPTPLTEVSERLYAAALQAGHGGEDLAVVAKALESLAGSPGVGPEKGHRP